MAGKEGREEKLSGGLRAPCTGRNQPAAMADVESSKEGLRSHNRRAAKVADDKEKIAEEAVIGAKRKAKEEVGGSSDGEIPMTAMRRWNLLLPGDATVEPPETKKLVEMPRLLRARILARERDTGPLKSPFLSPETNEEDRMIIEKLTSFYEKTQYIDDDFFLFQAPGLGP